MAGVEIKDLVAVGTLADDDLLVVSDTSDSDTAKKATPAQLRTPPSVSVVATTKTLGLTDALTIQECSNASPQAITIPANASVAFATGTWIIFEQHGAGAVSVTGDTGVTVNGASGGTEAILSQYGAIYIRKLGTNTWICVGDLA